MCLLTYLPPNVMPDTCALLNGAEFNRDGHGFAIVTRPRIIIQHGMDAERVVDAFARVRASHREGPALFHSRLGTHGTIGRANCHPFRVGGDTRTILAHNGIMPKKVQPRKGEVRSDTRIMAEDFLPRQPFGSIDTRRGRARFEKWLGRHNKVVILTVDPHYKRSAYLLNEDSGIWDNGIWYSNSDYTPARSHDYWSRWWPTTSDGTCRTCFAPDVIDSVTRICLMCGTCDDCGEPDGYCACYAPAKLANH